MNRFMARAGAALACVILAGAALAAQTRDDLDAPVAKGSSITYRSLVAGVFKDFQDGRLRAIDSVLTLSVGGLCEKSFQEALSWRTEKDGDSPYPRIIAAVTLTRGPGENESPECLERKIKPRRETFTETYRWDKAKRDFISDGRSFKGLDRFNRDNFEAGAGPRAVTTKGGICSS